MSREKTRGKKETDTHLVFQAQKGSCSQGCWSETCLLLWLWQSRKKKWNTHWLKQQASPLDAETQQGAAASQGGKHLDFSYSETWAICWGHLETALSDGCWMPPKAPGKGDEILVTDWCWGHLTKDDPTSTQFTPAPQEQIRNCLPSGDDHFCSLQKAGAPDEVCSQHLTGTAAELRGMALSVLSQHSTADPWHQLECPIQRQPWTPPASSKGVLCQWMKPTMQSPPCLQRPPCPFSTSWEALPGWEAPLKHHHSAMQRCRGEDTHAATPGWQLCSTAFSFTPTREEAKALTWTGQTEKKKACPCLSHSKALFCSEKTQNEQQQKTPPKNPQNPDILEGRQCFSVWICFISSRHQKNLQRPAGRNPPAKA